jgi:hypothetical protein
MRVQPTTASGLRSRLVEAEKELREDESGAMMIIGLFFALFLVGALYYLIGIGQSIMYRERLQDAADTAAFAGAVLKARAMNFIALINMIMALLLAILIAIYAVYLMLAAAGYVILPGICAATGPWCPPCALACPLISPTIQAANWVKNVYQTVKNFVEPIIKAGSTAGNAISQGGGIAAAAASALRVETTYRPPAVIGASLASADPSNGNNPVGRLPSRKAPYSELCRKAKEYADAPFRALRDVVPIVGDIIRFIGGAFIGAAAAVVCEGSTTAPSLNDLGRSLEPGSGAPAFVHPRTDAQNKCLLDGNDAECTRFEQYMKESNWDQTQGICEDVASDPITHRASLPAGANRTACENRIRGAASACVRSGYFDYVYTLQDTARTLRKDAPGVVSGRTGAPRITRLYIDGPHANPLCGSGGTWSTSTDLNQCIKPRSLRLSPDIDPRTLVPPMAVPRTPDEALAVAQRYLQAETTPVGSTVIVEWTQVRHILSCKENLPPRNGELVEPGSSGCDMRPQWVVPDSLELGDQAFQQYGMVVGSRGDRYDQNRYTSGVAAANRFNSGGGDTGGFGVLSTISSAAGNLSFAQAEFYYNGPNAGSQNEWLWNMGWTARMRRVRMPANLRSGGGQVGGFNITSVAENLIIH